MRYGWTYGALLSVTALSACAAVPNLGPAPQIATPQHFAATLSLSGQDTGTWPGSDWWVKYGDAQLNGLIAEAVADSPDLAVATARVRQAEAIAQEAGAARWPTLDASASAGEVKQSYNNGVPPAFVPHGWNDTGRAAVQLGFDPDLWGRNRAAYAAARSDAAAARLDRAQAALTLSTGIADAYADLARLYAERAVQVAALDVREQTVRLTASRVATGLDTQAELKQAQSAVPTARGDIAATDETIALTRNRIAALLGKGPDRGLAIAPPVAVVGSRPLPADITTDLIGRRPDVVAARTRVEAEAARIKVARAAFYPSINISALFGFQALGLGDLFKSGSTMGSVGPAVSLPIFHGGALSGQYRAARGRFDEAVASYDRTVTDAYHAAADAVTSRRALVTRLGEAQQALNEAERAYAIAQQRYEGGLSRFLDVLSAQDRVLQARRSVADLNARSFTLDIALVRALGGGFRGETDSASRLSKDVSHG